MRAWLLAFILVIGVRRPARANDFRFGAAIGARAVELGGQQKAPPRFGGAIAFVIERRLAPSLAISVEPGYMQAGSDLYHLSYVALPLFGRARHTLSSGTSVCGAAGVRVSRLTRADRMTEDDDGRIAVDVREHLRDWDLSLVAGIGVERPRFYVDIRYARGLLTVHADDPALFVVNEELGLWMGLRL